MAAPERWGVSRNAQLGRGGQCHAVAATYRIGAQGQGQPVMVTENVTFWKLNPVLNTSPKGFGIYCWYNIS